MGEAEGPLFSLECHENKALGVISGEEADDGVSAAAKPQNKAEEEAE